MDPVRDNPGEPVPEGTFRHLLDFLEQNEDNTGRCTNNLNGLPWCHPIQTTVTGAPISAIPTIFTQDTLHCTTLPIYPGLGQATNMLAFIPGSLVFCSILNIIKTQLDAQCYNIKLFFQYLNLAWRQNHMYLPTSPALQAVLEQPFYSISYGTTRVSQDQKKNIYPLTPILIINHLLSASSIYYKPQHPPCSIYVLDSLFEQNLSPSPCNILLCTQKLP